MPEQLGRIERLEAERFKRGRKIYLVPLVYFDDEAPDEYKEKCERYWRQAAEQLTNLADKIGKVKRVYCESVFQSGQDGMKAIERLNSNAYRIAKAHCENGAFFEAVEERALLEEMTDWQRCLMLGLASPKVASKVWEFYIEAAKKRNESIAKKISETLKDDEAGLLFIREEQSMQFAANIEVFTVFPPALDEIRRWLREQAVARVEKASTETKANGKPSAEHVEEEDDRKKEKDAEP